MDGFREKFDMLHGILCSIGWKTIRNPRLGIRLNMTSREIKLSIQVVNCGFRLRIIIFIFHGIRLHGLLFDGQRYISFPLWLSSYVTKMEYNTIQYKCSYLRDFKQFGSGCGKCSLSIGMMIDCQQKHLHHIHFFVRISYWLTFHFIYVKKLPLPFLFITQATLKTV